MRTAQDIVDHYHDMARRDLFGWEAEILLHRLTAEEAMPLLDKTADVSEWPEPSPLDEQTITAEMRDYMEFAWDKARGHRGISASRSVAKMRAWVWLLGDEELLRFAKDHDNYPQYGAPILAEICRKYGFPIPEGEDVIRMSRGEPCSPGCDMGCNQ